MSLAKLRLGEFSERSHLGFEPSLVNFDRQFAAAGKPLPQAFLPGLVLNVLVSLFVELLMTFTKSSSSESFNKTFVICPFLCLDCDLEVPIPPPPSVSISVPFLLGFGHFAATPSSVEYPSKHYTHL